MGPGSKKHTKKQNFLLFLAKPKAEYSKEDEVVCGPDVARTREFSFYASNLSKGSLFAQT